MNKNELMKNMSQAYLLLSEKKKEEFSRNGMNLRYNLRFMSFYFYPFFIIVSRISFYVV